MRKGGREMEKEREREKKRESPLLRKKSRLQYGKVKFSLKK